MGPVLWVFGLGTKGFVYLAARRKTSNARCASELLANNDASKATQIGECACCCLQSSCAGIQRCHAPDCAALHSGQHVPPLSIHRAKQCA